MWHNTRRGHNLIRKRKSNREESNKKSLKQTIVMLVFIAFFVVGISAYIIIDRYNNIGVQDIADNTPYNETPVKVYTEPKDDINNIDNNGTKNDETENKNEITFTTLGEIMMGGTNFESYTLPYKDISEYTKVADYTVAFLSTSITSLKKIENPETKYIVKKDILNTFSALGIDAVNVANDHALDFGTKIFNSTKAILETEELDIIGLKNTIVYAEQNGIRVAFIGTCNEVIGMQMYYEKAGINMYNLKRIEEDIKLAKTKADIVVVMAHLGLENEYKKTSIMNWYYKELIEFGADVVVGSHALGIYPIELYKGKPILYSLGYIMSDTDSELGKESGIFTFTANKKGKITKLEIIPTYIKDKEESVLYYEYNKTKAIKLLNKIGENIKTKNKNIEDGKLTIQFN